MSETIVTKILGINGPIAEGDFVQTIPRVVPEFTGTVVAIFMFEHQVYAVLHNRGVFEVAPKRDLMHVVNGP